MALKPLMAPEEVVTGAQDMSKGADCGGLQGAALLGCWTKHTRSFHKRWLSAQYCFISSNQAKMVSGCRGPQSDIWADYDTVPEEEVNMCPIQGPHQCWDFLSANM